MNVNLNPFGQFSFFGSSWGSSNAQQDFQMDEENFEENCEIEPVSRKEDYSANALDRREDIDQGDKKRTKFVDDRDNQKEYSLQDPVESLDPVNLKKLATYDLFKNVNEANRSITLAIIKERYPEFLEGIEIDKNPELAISIAESRFLSENKKFCNSFHAILLRILEEIEAKNQKKMKESLNGILKSFIYDSLSGIKSTLIAIPCSIVGGVLFSNFLPPYGPNLGAYAGAALPMTLRWVWKKIQTLDQFLENTSEIRKITEITVNRYWMNVPDECTFFIPQQIGKLTHLRKLDIEGKFKEIPKEIGQLTLLEELELSGVYTDVPQEIEQLTHLRKLNLVGNFKEVPSQIRKLTNLTDLRIWGLFTDFPIEVILSLANLLRLRIAGEFTTFSKEIGKLKDLLVLSFEYSRLQELPKEVDQLTSLQELNLSWCRELSALPNEILNLSSECRVNIQGSGLSQEVLNHLKLATESPDYQGPAFHYSMREVEEEAEEKSSNEILRNLFEENQEEYAELIDLHREVNSEDLKAWLNRLSYMMDFKAGTERRKWLISNILKNLRLANCDPDFRQIFSLAINEASSTCGDRMALSILHLGIQHQLATIDLKNLSVLANFLVKGVWAMALLEEIARKKVKTLAFVDEIEVFLAYPVKLKEQLDLPIDVEGMLYYHVSDVTENDLQMACDIVLKKRNDKRELCAFLVTQEKWLKALQSNYSREFQSLKTIRDAGMQTSQIDYSKLEKSFTEGLVALTEKALKIQNVEVG